MIADRQGEVEAKRMFAAFGYSSGRRRQMLREVRSAAFLDLGQRKGWSLEQISIKLAEWDKLFPKEERISPSGSQATYRRRIAQLLKGPWNKPTKPRGKFSKKRAVGARHA
jgi:hypothetical protein